MAPFDPANDDGQRNVFGEALQACTPEDGGPVTGFYRDGCCNTGPDDVGSHTVCAVVTEAFLAFSAARGNDLASPLPAFGFPGLAPGDRWCLCAARWQEALDAGKAPQVVLRATNMKALEILDMADLKRHAADLT